MALLTTVPTEIMFGSRGPWFVEAAVAVADASVLIARLAWRRQVRRFAGAMG